MKNLINKSAVKGFSAFIFLALACFITPAFAEPYLAFKNNLFCSACHINPIGGGARNTFGAYYGTQVLPQTPGSMTQFDGGSLGETFRVGANFRANYYQSDRKESDDTNTAAQDTKTFETQSGQIYLIFQPKDSRFSLYLDEQVAPGGALNREAFILTKLTDTNFLKVGKLMLPYGIRLEDDTAFIRQATGFNFDTSDNGIEWDIQSQKTFISFAVSNGSTSTTNDDKRMMYLTRAEYLGNNWRIGVSGVLNDAEVGRRTQANIFGGFNLLGFTFLAEADRIQDKSIMNIPDEYEQQRIGFFEVNREIIKGYNLKLTTEYFDPDSHIDQNQRVRHSVLLEYTPFSNVQIRTGLRKGADIPQKSAGNYVDFFAQMHFYF